MLNPKNISIDSNYLVTDNRKVIISFLVDDNGIIISWNKAAEKITGYSLENIQHKHISFLCDGSINYEYVLSEALQYANEAGYAQIDLPFKSRNADTIRAFFHINKSDHFNKAECGFIINIEMMYLEDFTEYISDKVLSVCSDAVYSTDANFKITTWNNAAENLYGFQFSEIAGSELKDVVRPIMSESLYKEIDDSMKENGFWKGKIDHRKADGSVLHISESISLIKGNDDTIKGYLWISRDITEEVKREAELLKVQEQLNKLELSKSLKALEDYRYALDEANIVAITDEKGIIKYVNDNFCKISGYTVSELIGKDLAIVNSRYHPREFFHEMWGTISHGKIWKSEIKNKTKEGDFFWVDTTIVPFINENGKPYQYVAIQSNISNRKNAEYQLIYERTLLRLLIDNLPDYISVKDNNLKYLINNKASLEFLGVATEQETIGKTLFDFLPVKLADEFVKDDLQVLDTREPIINKEILFETEDSEKRWMLSTKVPMNDDNNNAIGLITIRRDITQRKKILELVYKEKELSDSIINSLPGIFYLYDDKGKFLRWNKQFETVSGYTAEEIGNMTPDMFFDDDEKEYIKGRIENVFANGFSDAECHFYTKDKKKIPYYFTGVAVQYENKPCLLGSGIDITLRKEAEFILRESEMKYKMLFMKNPLPMWMFAVDTPRIIDVNEAAILHYGYSREEFLRMNLKDLRPVEDVEMFLESVTKVVPGNLKAGVWKHKKKNGALIEVEIYRDDLVYQGLPVRLVMANDITDKLRADKKLMQSLQEIRQLASHLQDVREEERKMIAREIHDELGQQLTGLKMDISWLSRKIDPSNEILQQKIKSISELLDLTVKSVRKISTELRPSIIDDLGLIDALKWYSIEFEKRSGVKVSFSTNMQTGEVPIDYRIGLFRVYQESLTNVARHSEATMVEASLVHDNDSFLLTIADNGKGFNSEIIAAKKTLGLLGMKERTLMMGGTYEITSKQGAGTTVSVTIPLKQL